MPRPRSRSRWILGSVVAATTLTVMVPAGAASDRVLVIGSLAPESGDSSVVLDSLRTPVEIAVSEINAAGGVNGQAVRLVTGDEGSDPATARATFQRFVTTDRADVVIGPVTSRAAVALQSQIGAARVLTCSGADHSAPIVESSSKGFYVRTAPPDRLEGQALAELVLAAGHTRVTILARDDHYGTTIAEPLRRSLEQGGAKVVVSATYDPARPDVSAALRRAVAATTNAVVVIGFVTDGTSVVQAMQTAGLGPKTTAVYVTDGMQIAAGDPSVVAGIKGVAPAETAFGVQSPFPAALSARGVAPVFSAATYDCTILTALAAVRAKSDDPVKMRAAFSSNLRGQRDCSTFAVCVQLLGAGKSIHWRGASSNFARWAGVEPGEGTYDVWSYDANGSAVNGDPSTQIRVP